MAAFFIPSLKNRIVSSHGTSSIIGCPVVHRPPSYKNWTDENMDKAFEKLFLVVGQFAKLPRLLMYLEQPLATESVVELSTIL